VYGTEVEAMAQEVFGNKQKNGFYKVTFGGNVQPLRFRARSTAGIRNSRSGDTVLYNWLKNNKVSGNLFGYSNARTGVKGGNVDMSNLDVTVNLRTMLRFCDYARKHGV